MGTGTLSLNLTPFPNTKLFLGLKVLVLIVPPITNSDVVNFNNS